MFEEIAHALRVYREARADAGNETDAERTAILRELSEAAWSYLKDAREELLTAPTRRGEAPGEPAAKD